MGISQKDQIESFGFCEDIKLFPVRFETEKLPFPVVGMSDVMPYQSTRYQDMTDEMLKQWKSAFQKQIDKAINEFQPDLIISHHMWILSIFTKVLFPEIPLYVISHGTGLRQLKLAKQFSQDVIFGSKKIDHVFASYENISSKTRLVMNEGNASRELRPY